MTDPRPPHRQSGFTLLELIVALVVLGFLLIGLTQGVRAGLEMWGAQRHRLADTADLDAAARVLRNLLTGIPQVPPEGFTKGPEGHEGVRGTRQRFTFVGDLPTGLGTVRRADIRLELDRHRLVLLWAPHRHELLTGPPPRPTQTELVGGVGRLQLAYWGPPAAGQPARWLAAWRGPGNPPLIRVRLAFEKGDPRHWPDLIVAPRL
ncbi:MAG TPA: prepilin-type N-terminal cleavage/methylation domain-containing protein [Stellaceae bacterium]|nr:prepilin-type N-terminal cleavage/methylation domain-containing protein [Stellaceae bacterium]